MPQNIGVNTVSKPHGSQDTKRGLFIGRFQPVHLGHISAISKILETVEELIIVIGSAQYSHTLENPFTASERLLMLQKALREKGLPLDKIWMIPLPDLNRNSLWVTYVRTYCPPFTIIFSNNPLVKILFQEQGFIVKPISFFNRNEYSSTNIRQLMIKKGNWSKFVPHAVEKIIREINGPNRLQQLLIEDKPIKKSTQK